MHQQQPREAGTATYLGCAGVDRIKDGCGDPIAGGPRSVSTRRDAAAIILLRDGAGSAGTVSCRHSDSRRRSGSQSMDIWKVSERAIFTIQRIVRVSPEPRFVSSVSWHCARPQALTPRSFQPKHDTDDAKEGAWIAPQYNGKRDCQPIAGQFGQVVNAYSCSRSPWFTATTGLPLPSQWGGRSRSDIDKLMHSA